MKFRYILGDSWYSSSENMRFVKKQEKVFIFEQKENLLITGSESKRKQGLFERLARTNIPEESRVKVWIKALEFHVMIFKQVFRNKDGREWKGYMESNEESLREEQFRRVYKKRWSVEEYHKSIKSKASIAGYEKQEKNKTINRKKSFYA